MRITGMLRNLSLLIIILCSFGMVNAADNKIDISDDTMQRVINEPDEDFTEISVAVTYGENVDISVGSVADDVPDQDSLIDMVTELPDISLNVAGDVSSTSRLIDWTDIHNTAIEMKSWNPEADFKVNVGGNVTVTTTSDLDFNWVSSEGVSVGTETGGKSEVEITGTVTARADGSAVSGDDPSYDYDTDAQAFLVHAYYGGMSMIKTGGASADAVGSEYGGTFATVAHINAGDKDGKGTVAFTSEGNLSASAVSSGMVDVQGVYLNTGFDGSRINLTVENGGGISAGATGSDGSVYGIYADTDAGTINAIIDGNVTQTSTIESTFLGSSAAILTTGVEGAINIQVGEAVTDVPPEAMVSGSDAGIFNYSDDDVEKNIIVWGKVSGGAASVLTESNMTTDNFNLTLWEIKPNEIGGEQHTAASRVRHQAVSDELSRNIENNIRYIILIDPDFADKVEISGANEGVDLKGETYYWANLSDTVTLVSADPEYSISEAWRDTEESKALTCDAGSCSFEVPIEGAIWLNGELEKVSPTETPTETPEPTSTPEPAGCPCVWCCGALPRTGFSSERSTLLPEQPKDVDYKPTRMLLQIPVLNIRTELVTVPLKDGIWQVEWLKDRAGVLEGSALPGNGISIVAAHNTLNHTEYGPFAMLREAEINDLITVKTANGSVSGFRVYANVLLEPDDIQKLVKIAGQEENSLVLVTCENESVEGGYLNRRVVFAKPN